jgi:hypothetical protein
MSDQLEIRTTVLEEATFTAERDEKGWYVEADRVEELEALRLAFWNQTPVTVDGERAYLMTVELDWDFWQPSSRKLYLDWEPSLVQGRP